MDLLRMYLPIEPRANSDPTSKMSTEKTAMHSPCESFENFHVMTPL